MKRLKLLPLAAIALIGCLDGTGPRRPGRPNALISDGAHGTTHTFFFFLPPMVPKPTPTGTFDRFRSPAVEICQLAGDENSSCTTTIATFTMTSGPGSVIRVVPADKHYIVNWHTNLFPALLPSPTIYRIQVFDQVSALLLGFADVQLADNGKEAKSLTSDQMIGLVDGRTLPIKFRIEFGAVDLCPEPEITEPCARATVGTDGGQLVATDDDGVPLAFADFPAGWTDTPREVEIRQLVNECDGECGPGEGPLGGAPVGARQYPLFFEYTTIPLATPEAPFNRSVRIGVCNVGDEGAFHPPPGTTVLALGATEEHGFTILDLAPTSDLLGGCVGVTPTPGEGGEEVGLNRLDGWQGLLARAGMLAANVLAPRALEAAVVVDGGMGGSTDFFSPVGTVDTAPPEVEIDGTMSPGEWGESVASLLVNLPGGGTTPGELFISNDATNLYFAVRFQRSVVDPGNSAAFEFDSNDNSSLDEGDDGIILNPSSSVGFSDLVRSSAPPCPPTAGLCSLFDTQRGGTNDGAAAFLNDGTFTVYEFSHPLSSGDALDFSRRAGQTLGLFLSIRLLVSGASFADTRFPAEGFHTITIDP
jgi:hypothetical protein